MSSIDIDLNELRTLLDHVKPFAGSSKYDLQVLTAVYLKTYGEHLTAAATDRYVVGMSRTKVDQVVDFEALIKLADVRHILAMFKARKDIATKVTLTVAGEAATGRTLTVSLADGLFANADDLTAKYTLVDGQFPPVTSIFTDRVDPTEYSTTGYNPQYLAKFAHVVNDRGEPIRVAHGCATKPTIFQAGDYFLGAIMPVRLNEKGEIAELADWTTMLAPPKPKTRRRATKKAAA